MNGFILFILIVIYLSATILAAMKPRQGSVSEYERGRRQDPLGTELDLDMLRDDYYGSLLGLRFVLICILLFLFTVTLTSSMNWLVAVLVFAVGLALQLALVGTGSVRGWANGLLMALEPRILRLLAKYPLLARALARLPLPDQKPVQIHSREEMFHIATESRGVLTAKEVKRIQKVLEFSEIDVKSVMTPRSVVEVVQSEDLLGPLRLDELHKTGYSRFPVVDGDIDSVIGVVYIRSLLELTDKRSRKAKDLMDSPVHYIKETQTLEHALGAFLRTRHHLFVVVNEYRETVGILTLEDVIEKLIGERILDQFDRHDDLRAVAARNVGRRAQSTKSRDV